MTQQTGPALALQLADGRTITAQPRPEDQERLAGLLGDRRSFRLGQAEADTEGHSLSTDVTVDVEGHALTLRLPTQADAEALRRAIALGAVTATIVAAGAIAAMQGAGAPTQAQTVNPAVPQAPPAQTLAERREARLGEIESYPAAPAGGSDQTDNRQSQNRLRSGPLE